MSDKRSKAAAALGRIRSPRKAASSAENARRATGARMATMTPEQRREQAQKAARARWGDRPAAAPESPARVEKSAQAPSRPDYGGAWRQGLDEA